MPTAPVLSLESPRVSPGLPLPLLRPGTSGIVQTVGGAAETRCRLGTLGFVPGAEVTVVCHRGGDLIVMVKDTRIALDRATARRVLTAD